jgi:transcription elongation factor
MKNSVKLGMLVAAMAIGANAEPSWIATSTGTSVVPPTTVRMYNDSRFMACWEGTTMNSVYFNNASSGWVLKATTHNTPKNTSVTKFCGFGDIKSDWGLAVYTTLRQARTSNRNVQLGLDNAVTDDYLGWKITEVSIY